jgi:hypothetical protein
MREVPPEFRRVAIKPPWIPDPIDMEYALEALEVEAETRNRLVAVQYETIAAVYGAIAKGATQVAEILGGGAKG